jgi:hypothetical protein
MIFRAYALENPGVWGWPQVQTALRPRNKKEFKNYNFLNRYLPRIKTVAFPGSSLTRRVTIAWYERAREPMSERAHATFEYPVSISYVANGRNDWTVPARTSVTTSCSF